jgi:hypothetical protein
MPFLRIEDPLNRLLVGGVYALVLAHASPILDHSILGIVKVIGITQPLSGVRDSIHSV